VPRGASQIQPFQQLSAAERILTHIVTHCLRRSTVADAHPKDAVGHAVADAMA